MSNEEIKSNEIAAEYLVGHDRLEITYEEMREAIMTMANWKDRQFKEYLEQKLNSYLAYSGSDVINIQNMGARAAIREIINELFEETESDNSDREE